MTKMTMMVSVLGAGAMLLSGCGSDERVAGNSANTGNAQATGRILDAKGFAAPGVFVECRPDSLAPWDRQLSGWNTMTDSVGRYLCTELPYGRVGISAIDPGSGLSRWRLETLTPDATQGPEAVDTLARPGAIRVALPPASYGTLYLTGLNLRVAVMGTQEIDIPNVPAGWTGSVKFATSATTSILVASGLRVDPATTDSAGYTRRFARIRVALEGGATSPVVQFPLLVRLDSSWQGFASSLPDGSDLRLTTTSGKPLPLTIASWDRAGRTAALWTLLDSLAAPAASVDLVLSWGIPVGASPAEVFSASQNWLAAWPLGDSTTSAIDRLNTLPGVHNRTSVVPGPIAKASRFDGKSSHVSIPSSETGALVRPEGGPFTYSCWVLAATASKSGYVMGRGKYGSGLEFEQTNDSGFWKTIEYKSSPSGKEFKRGPAILGKWTHLAMTVSGSNEFLFIDGILQSKDSTFDRDNSGRKDAMFMIGASIDTAGLTSTFAHFGGDISEVWVQSVARSADWIRLAAANQKPGAKGATLLE
ncbi:MAG: LamG domain-containing protein [Fibrobacterota bacterium]|nr:LamG domain-containing protein [Fibrobacterota bacterium]QQS06252.1 MAG: LamG domain-containing protein [Fibrobacterota bacterium]